MMTKTKIKELLAEALKIQSDNNSGIVRMYIGKTLYLLEIVDFNLFIDSAHVILVHNIPYLPMPFSICSEDEDGRVFFGHVEVDSANKELQEKFGEVRREALAGGYQEGGTWWV